MKPLDKARKKKTMQSCKILSSIKKWQYYSSNTSAPIFTIFIIFLLSNSEAIPLPFPPAILHSWLFSCSEKYSLRARRSLKEDFPCHTSFFECLCFPLFLPCCRWTPGKKGDHGNPPLLAVLLAGLPLSSWFQEMGIQVYLEKTQVSFRSSFTLS